MPWSPGDSPTLAYGGTPPAQAAGDLQADLIERQHAVGPAGADDGPRHAPNHAAGFVLHHHAAPGLPDALAAAAAVLAHAGQNNGKGVRPAGAGDRAQ